MSGQSVLIYFWCCNHQWYGHKEMLIGVEIPPIISIRLYMGWNLFPALALVNFLHWNISCLICRCSSRKGHKWEIILFLERSRVIIINCVRYLLNCGLFLGNIFLQRINSFLELHIGIIYSLLPFLGPTLRRLGFSELGTLIFMHILQLIFG